MKKKRSSPLESLDCKKEATTQLGFSFWSTKKYRDARLMTLISNRMKKVHLLLRSVVNQLFEILPFTWYIFLFPMKFLETTIFPNPPTFYNEQLRSEEHTSEL